MSCWLLPMRSKIGPADVGLWDVGLWDVALVLVMDGLGDWVASNTCLVILALSGAALSDGIAGWSLLEK